MESSDDNPGEGEKLHTLPGFIGRPLHLGFISPSPASNSDL
jgi:hypothetical protein